MSVRDSQASRATYIPLTRLPTAQSRHSVLPPGTPQSTKGRFIQLPPLEEEDSRKDNRKLVVLQTDTVPRDYYEPPAGFYSVQPIEDFSAFLARTHIHEIFQGIYDVLLKQPQLPYNPYPGIVSRIRKRAERFHMVEQVASDRDIQDLLESKIIEEDLTYIVSSHHNSNVFGLDTIVQAVDPITLRQYAWLLKDLTPHASVVSSNSREYSIQVMTALTGTSVFHGTFYQQPMDLVVRIEVLVSGSTIEKCLFLFAECIVRDLQYMERKGPHTFLGVLIPVPPNAASGNWGSEIWQLTRIQNNMADFEDLVVAAVTAKKLIQAKFIFQLDEVSAVCRPGLKQYSMNCIVQDEDRELEDDGSLTSFTNQPLMTLHEGVFMTRGHADAYLGMFVPKLEPGMQKESNTRNKYNQDDIASLQSQGQISEHTENPSLVQPQSENKPSWRDRLFKTNKPSNMAKVDGFRDEEREEERKVPGPTSWQFISPLKSLWQRSIAVLHPQADVFTIAHYTLLLTLMERNGYDPKLVIELYHFLHSTAARLHTLMQRNKALRSVISRFLWGSQLDVVSVMFMEYKKELITLLGSELQERSSDFIAAGRVVSYWLDEVLPQDGSLSTKVPLTQHTLDVLASVNLYCVPILLTLVDDAIFLCPMFRYFLEDIGKLFPDHYPAPETREGRIQLEPRHDEDADEETFIHGAELETLIKHGRTVIDVNQCIERDNSTPKIMVKEAILLRYTIDVHLDETWREFLEELSASTFYPPNPFPRFVTKLRQSSVKMEINVENDRKLTEKLYQKNLKLVDEENQVYTILGSGVYGLETALLIMDNSQFFPLLPQVMKLVNSNYHLRTRKFKMAICAAVCSHTPLYGKIQPYLHQIELHEHYFVRGITGGTREGISVMADKILEHIGSISQSTKLILMGVYLGEEEQHWTVESILQQKQTFHGEVEKTCGLKEPIFLKVYIVQDWRYIPVIKHFMMHYVNNEETEHELFFPSQPVSIYQNVFFEKEKAIFFLQHAGPVDVTDVYSTTNIRSVCRSLDETILECKNRGDYLAMQRRMLTRGLIQEDPSQVSDAWRMFHSIAGRVEYCNSLVASMIDLVRYAIEKQSVTTRPKQNNASQLTMDESELHWGNLDLTIFSRMTTAFRSKVLDTVTSKSALQPVTLSSYLEAKLKGCTQRDEESQEMIMVVEEGTIKTLREMQHFLQYIQDVLAYDVHMTCTNTIQKLKDLEKDVQRRPVSVYSNHIRHPDEYQLRPRAQMNYD